MGWRWYAIINNYYQYLLDEATGDHWDFVERYSKLLKTLFDTEFCWVIQHDENRAIDGNALRRHFGLGNGLHYEAIDRILPFFCSVLEMLVALAKRFDGEFLWDPDKGNQTPYCFHLMLDNLGLLEFDNSHYDEEKIYQILEIFMNREYPKNGKNGGLFFTNFNDIDMRNEEIWYQLNYFVQEHFSV